MLQNWSFSEKQKLAIPYIEQGFTPTFLLCLWWNSELLRAAYGIFLDYPDSSWSYKDNVIWSEKAYIWQQELFTVRNNTDIFCSNDSSEYCLSYSYSVDVYMWMFAHMSRICQSRQSTTNQAPLIPLPRHLHHSPDLTIFISDSSIFQSSDFTPTVQPDPASLQSNLLPDPPQLHLSLTTTISPRSSLHFLQIRPSFHPLWIDLTGATTAAR